MIRVLVVDDQSLLREGLVALLQLDPGIEVVGEAGNGEEACQIAETLHPDVILMDIRMPDCDGIEATKIILSKTASTKIVILTTFADDKLVVEALRAGACGYLLKDSEATKISEAVRSAVRGLATMDSSVLNMVANRFRNLNDPEEPLKQLKSRELQILKLVGAGKTNREISFELSLTEGTVKNYVTRIFTILGVKTREEAITVAKKSRIFGLTSESR